MSEARTADNTRIFLEKWVTNVKLHDPSPPKTAAETFNFLVEIANIVNLRPEHLAVQVGEREYTPPIKRGAFEVQSGKFESFRAMGLMAYAFRGEKSDLNFSATISHCSQDLYVSFDATDTSRENALSLIKLSTERYAFSLGYSWNMQNCHSPFYFSSNVLNESTPQPLRRAQQNFIMGNRRELHQKGFFRDVFRVNILSRRHLSAIVGGVPFSDWVHAGVHQAGESEFARGQLSRLSENNWLWQVGKAELSSVRQAMIDAGLILSEITYEQYNAMSNPN